MFVRAMMADKLVRERCVCVGDTEGGIVRLGDSR